MYSASNLENYNNTTKRTTFWYEVAYTVNIHIISIWIIKRSFNITFSLYNLYLLFVEVEEEVYCFVFHSKQE